MSYTSWRPLSSISLTQWMRTAGTMGGCAGVKSANMLACVLLVGVRVEEAATHGRGTLLLMRYRKVKGLDLQTILSYDRSIA